MKGARASARSARAVSRRQVRDREVAILGHTRSKTACRQRVPQEQAAVWACAMRLQDACRSRALSRSQFGAIVAESFGRTDHTKTCAATRLHVALGDEQAIYRDHGVAPNARCLREAACRRQRISGWQLALRDRGAQFAMQMCASARSPAGPRQLKGKNWLHGFVITVPSDGPDCALAYYAP